MKPYSSPTPSFKTHIVTLLGSKHGDLGNTQRMPSECYNKPGKALEIGCASGSFLSQLKCYGWDVDGLELSAYAAQKAKAQGFNVICSSLEDFHLDQPVYDLVVGWMVLEHLHDPLGSLKKLYQITKPGANLVVSVPNFSYLGTSIFKSYEYSLHLPAHLSHFDERTIKLMLDKAGWKVTNILHQRVLGPWAGSLGFFISQLPLLRRISKYLVNYDRYFSSIDKYLYPIAMFLASIKQTGRMTVWAIKK